MAQSEPETEASAARRTENIPPWKEQEVAEIASFLGDYDSIGVVGFTGIPSRQLQQMRNELHGQASLRISRNTLMERALRSSDRDLEDLNEHLTGQVGLIGTNDNPFGLYRTLEESKSPAPISAGEVAPNEIVIPEGDTGIEPGPFVGDLQQVGAEARIEEGSIRVTADSVVAEAGDEVSADLAAVLAELEIEPKEVGLDLRVVYSDGVLFEPAELDIDYQVYRADVQAGAAAGRNLAVNAAFPTVRTADILLKSGLANATAIGIHARIEDPAVMPDLISAANAQVRSIAAVIDDESALPPDLRDIEEPAEESTPADGADESTPEEVDAEESSEVEEERTEESDDDDDGAEGLGEMFG